MRILQSPIRLGVAIFIAALLAPLPGTAAPQAAMQQSKAIRLNQAGSRDLQRLKSVGRVTAKRILKYRQQHGKFRSLSELQNVKGISKATYTRIVTQNKTRLRL